MEYFVGEFIPRQSFSFESHVINESDEIQAVEELKVQAGLQLEAGEFSKAKQFLDEALEMEPQDTTMLRARVDLNLKLNNPKAAVRDAENLITLHPDCFENRVLTTEIYRDMGDTREAILCLLRGFNSSDCQPKEAVSHLYDLCKVLFHHDTGQFTELLNGDPYECLCELGVLAYEKREFLICTETITTAQSLQRNQLGLRMRSLLTLANAHSALDNRDLAIAAYSDCLTAAVDTQDRHFQIKALVSLATLHLRSGDTHTAIIHYERLVDLRDERLEEEKECWTPALLVALFRNLCAAYQSIENFKAAQKFAGLLIDQLAEAEPVEGDKMADACLTAGDVADKLGEYVLALSHYKEYFSWAKKISCISRKGHSYGKLGRVYANLGNAKLSESYHAQFVCIAKKQQGDVKLQMEAHESCGDSMMLLKKFEAAKDSFQAFQRLAFNQNICRRITALYKLGTALVELHQVPAALREFQKAEMHADESEKSDLLLMVQSKMAEVMEDSTQLLQLDTAEQYLHCILPVLEEKVGRHREEGTFCDPTLLSQLDSTYRSLQTIHWKTGRSQECVEVADNARKWPWYRFLAGHSNLNRAVTNDKSSNNSLISSQMVRFAEAREWNVASIKAAITKQTSTVIFYSLIKECVQIWVLAPEKGLIRQFASPSKDKVVALLKEFYKFSNTQMHIFGEHRALPLKTGDLKHLIWRNKQRAKGSEEVSGEKPVAELHPEDLESYLSLLYEVLFSPIQDILDTLVESNKSTTKDHPRLTIIPDRELFKCPFNMLLDKRCCQISNRFDITVISSILMLERVLGNDLDHLAQIQVREEERQAFKSAGQPSSNVKRSHKPAVQCGTESKCMSNPLLTRKPVPTGLKTAAAEKLAAITPKKKIRKTPALDCDEDNLETSRRLLGTLTTETCTGTTIIRSELQVPAFRQVPDNDVFLAIGSAVISEGVDFFGKTWRPGVDLVKARQELRSIGDITDARVFEGKEATKEAFLREAPNATVLHIATWACLEEGLLAFTPNPSRQETGPAQMSSYLIGPEELLRLRLSARLVVLSSGWCCLGERKGTEDSFQMGCHLLPTLLLLAGAECVLTLLWPVPMEVLNLFYFHFYGNMKEETNVTQAVRGAVSAIRKIETYTDPRFWAGFVLVGKDVCIDLSFLRHAHLDGSLATVEQNSWTASEKQRSPSQTTGGILEVLNTPRVDAKVCDLTSKKDKLQEWIVVLLKTNKMHTGCIPAVCQQLEKALKTWQKDKVSPPSPVSMDALATDGVKFLGFLGFHILARGPYTEVDTPYVVYPTRTQLLACAFEASKAIAEIVKNAPLTETIFNCLPANQDILSYLVDLLCITKHARDIQLKVSDLSVKPLWSDPKLRVLLTTAGFSQIGLLLHFARTSANEHLLNLLLQLFLSLSATKSPILFHRLQVSLLGTASQQVGSSHRGALSSSGVGSTVGLPSLGLRLADGLTAGDEARVGRSVAWMSFPESEKEMKRKMALVERKSLLKAEEKNEVVLERHWEAKQLDVQAKDAKESYYDRPKLGQPIKVHPGGTPSATRIPLGHIPVLEVVGCAEKRISAHEQLRKPVDMVAKEFNEKDRRLVLPYI